MNSRLNVEEMTEHELLMELVEEKRRAEMFRWIKTFVFLAVLGAFAALCMKVVPALIEAYQKYNEMLKQVDEMVGRVNEFVDKVPPDAVDQITESLNSVSEVIGRIAKLFGR